MSELATIFEKIKEDFFSNHIKDENKEKYSLVFSPFSTGFNYDDFLFLDSNMASEDAQKYVDELYEFSQIANTIPRQDNFWAVSDHQDYLFNPFKNILNSLHLIDPDTFKIEMFYEHPIFPKALMAIDIEIAKPYRSFFELRHKFLTEIVNLRASLTDENRMAVDLEIKMKEENMRKIEDSWLREGRKNETESKILKIIKDEFKRFMSRFIETKAQLDTLIRNHAGSGSDYYLTSCMPNNLFKSDGLDWKKIELKKPEIIILTQKIDTDKYKDIMGASDLSNLEVEAIKFELLFVNVTRAWFDESILTSPFWDINILNKKEIDIPRITSKLIFVRNVDIKLPETSSQNKLLLQKNLIQNLGPFILNTTQIKANKSIQLNSVNKSLHVDRKTVLNVGANINNKQRRQNKVLSSVIAKKQNQFIALSPKIGKAKRANLNRTVRGTFLKPQLMKPILMTMAIAFLKYEFVFTEKVTGTPINILPNDVQLFQKNNLVKNPFSQKNINTLVANFIQNGDYKLSIKVEEFDHLELQFKAIPSRNSKAQLKKSIQLNRKIDEKIIENFQLIGVIAKTIMPFPNPVKGADYI